MFTKSFTFLFLATISITNGCGNPKYQNVTFFTTLDATVVDEIAYMAEFTLECNNNLVRNYSLCAEVDDKLLIAWKSGDRYLISWTEEVTKARAGSFDISVWDAHGCSVLRGRRQADGRIITPLIRMQLHHPGFYTGPSLNPKVLATLASTLLAFTAVRYKNMILASKYRQSVLV